MSVWTSAHDRAIAEGARRALTKRAARLRKSAADLTSHITDQHGRMVVITAPEGIVMLGTAALFDECTADISVEMRPC